jgi:hypothetical protein
MVTNTPSYYYMELIMAVKTFIVQGLSANDTKNFLHH